MPAVAKRQKVDSNADIENTRIDFNTLNRPEHQYLQHMWWIWTGKRFFYRYYPAKFTSSKETIETLGKGVK